MAKHWIELRHNEYTTVLRHILSYKDVSKENLQIFMNISHCLGLSNLLKEKSCEYYNEALKEKHKLFKEIYSELNETYKIHSVRIQYPYVRISKSFLANYITPDDLNGPKLPISLKRKLSQVFPIDVRLERMFYNELCKRYPNRLIAWQYPVRAEDRTYRVDCYFLDFNIAIEIDEWGHINNYNPESESIRQREIEDIKSCIFLRFDPYSSSETKEMFFKKIDDLIMLRKKDKKKELIKLAWGEARESFVFTDEVLAKINILSHYNDKTYSEIISELIENLYDKTMKSKTVNLESYLDR